MKNLIIVLVVMASACKSNYNRNDLNVSSPGASTFVYKTKGDYFNLVPVTLSEDKATIVAYPHPSDLKVNDDYSLPTRLKKGYLLDNRGISIHSAFLKLSYEEYSSLPAPPALDELYELILDKDPFEEFYSCGRRTDFDRISVEINDLIEKGKLKQRCGSEQ